MANVYVDKLEELITLLTPSGTSQLEELVTLLGTELPLLRPTTANWYGAAWPTNPTAGTPFFHTGHKRWGIYDGTYWLSEPIYASVAWPHDVSVSMSANVVLPQNSPQFRYYIERIDVSYCVNSGVINSSNYWSFHLYTQPGVVDLFINRNNIGATIGVWRSLNAVLSNVATNQNLLMVIANRNGSPGPMSGNALITYRRIFD